MKSFIRIVDSLLFVHIHYCNKLATNDIIIAKVIVPYYNLK
ncbi:hypothetical protein HMPREF0080_01460 [Anaeroglobus geminatus F0357]|uniref:Uncharacterized protein n=1 Tax=Anaeroglobus geminatus F0357 TaxID=861450 RepID=G9YIG8_9FIRM|nr:hypothetical protein HMPREF0080_01460 [Anaeroglobus geminatus F0357]